MLKTLTKIQVLRWHFRTRIDSNFSESNNLRLGPAFFSKHTSILCLVLGLRPSQKLYKYVSWLKPIRIILLIISQINGHCGIIQRKLEHS